MGAEATPVAGALRSGASTDRSSQEDHPIATGQRRRDQAEEERRKQRTLELLDRARDDLLPEDERQQCIDMAVQLNLPIAEALARRYRSRGEDLDDLIQVARLGLIQAVKRFSPDLGEFDPFAVPTIAGEIKRHFRDHFWSAPRPPRRIQELRQEAMAEWSELAQERGHLPTIVEIADRLGVNREEVREAVAASPFTSMSLDESDENSAGAGRKISVTDPGFDDIDDAMERDQLLAQLEEAIADLSDRDRLILQMRFVENRPQSVIAKRLGTSQMSVSRRLTKITGQLRQTLVDGSPGPAGGGTQRPDSRVVGAEIDILSGVGLGARQIADITTAR